MKNILVLLLIFILSLIGLIKSIKIQDKDDGYRYGHEKIGHGRYKKYYHHRGPYHRKPYHGKYYHERGGHYYGAYYH